MIGIDNRRVCRSLRLLTGMLSPKQMSFSVLQAVFWWTSRNMWWQQEAELSGNRQPSRNGFYSLLEQPIQEVLEGLPLLLGLGCLVFRHMWASCVSVPGLVLLLHYRWCRSVPAWRLAALPCSWLPALRWPEALGNWAFKKLKPTPTLVQAEELPWNSTKRYGCISNSHCAQCFSSCPVPRKWFTGSGP